MYKLTNRKTGQEYGPYKSKQTARRARDRRDNEYGAPVVSFSYYCDPYAKKKEEII